MLYKLFSVWYNVGSGWVEMVAVIVALQQYTWKGYWGVKNMDQFVTWPGLVQLVLLYVYISSLINIFTQFMKKNKIEEDKNVVNITYKEKNKWRNIRRKTPTSINNCCYLLYILYEKLKNIYKFIITSLTTVRPMNLEPVHAPAPYPIWLWLPW